MMKEHKIKEKYFLPLILFLIFYFYLISLFPAYKNNDSPEIAAASYTLGICHPPGYPFYINLSKIFTLIPVGNIAFRLNILSSLLAILTLLCTYFILKNISIFLLKKDNKLYSVISIFLLSFSYIFWNQAIEVKGGIYQLNLLLLSLIILLFLKLQMDFNLLYIFLLVYFYSISLTNHWQSMIILLPWIIFLLWYFREKLNFKSIFYIICFFITGLSVYVFLIIRGSLEPVISWGNISNVSEFFDFIMRKPYATEAAQFSVNKLIRNIKTFVSFFLINYWFLWIFCIPGAFILFRKNKIIFFSFMYIIFFTFFAVVFYNARTKLEVIWLLKIFFMPIEYMVLLLISLGIFSIFTRHKTFFFIILFFLVFLLLRNSINSNYRTRDFFSYDMAFNLFNTLKKDSFYFTEKDMYFFPLLYEQTVNRKRSDIKLIPISFLQFRWWAKKIENKYGYVNISTENIINNYQEFIKQSMNMKDIIYRDFSSELFDEILKLNYITNFSGLLKIISKKKLSESSLIFKLYSLRGFYSSFAQTDENIELITRYMIFSALHAEKLMRENRYNEAIELYNFALRIPVEKHEYLIYYNLSLCYNKIDNYEKELFYLNKCLLSKPDYVFAHEKLAIYYFKMGLKNEARIYLENAIKYGSSNKTIIDLFNNL